MFSKEFSFSFFGAIQKSFRKVYFLKKLVELNFIYSIENKIKLRAKYFK